jgi:hypothetical protein
LVSRICCKLWSKRMGTFIDVCMSMYMYNMYIYIHIYIYTYNYIHIDSFILQTSQVIRWWMGIQPVFWTKNASWKYVYICISIFLLPYPPRKCLGSLTTGSAGFDLDRAPGWGSLGVGSRSKGQKLPICMGFRWDFAHFYVYFWDFYGIFMGFLWDFGL